ncbi:hypothetical protein Glove_87g38 [Diversispora epigaea]|uniref:HCP-like protein n=1 Tax=Diversispora epigaea TaxID=1348612 RepID=A0A397J688_9GLOM|nr:hypothetical protein Glove_87g38 [Diversispora epigaea]
MVIVGIEPTEQNEVQSIITYFGGQKLYSLNITSYKMREKFSNIIFETNSFHNLYFLNKWKIYVYRNENRTYLKSAEGGNNDGQFILGNYYMNGIGTKKDEEKAFQWYLKSAEGWNSDGTKDEEKIFQWYLKSAEGGNSKAMFKLGNYYMNGIGTTKDEEKAFQWYLKSAEGGMGSYFLESVIKKELKPQNIKKNHSIVHSWNSLSMRIGTTKDEKKAFQWYLKSAEGGNSEAMFEFGNRYEYGIGTTKDEEKVFQWYLKSAEGGNSNGQYYLGISYKNGQKMKRNHSNSDGQCNLGDCYKDEEKAFQWYMKLAEEGNSKAMFNLGDCHYIGIGTTKDEEKAFRWYLKSTE